ncbi:inverse autotransporter beta domain-containing protein [Sodalis sp. RH23]|uniref:inverse autotransporter beta domain-containing protein n=1 Tax=unclassified Sodalis (in: enterobacteria) TaxID=2636512 RepID=UPI0039B6B0CF
MIYTKWHVTVISIAALLAGCFSTDKKKELKKTSTHKGEDITIREKLPQPNFNDHTLHESLLSIPSLNENALSSKDNTTAPRVKHGTPSGTSAVNLPIKHNLLTGASFDFLVPLTNRDERMLFSQLGIRRHNAKSIINIGVGQRHFFESWMLGYNAFYDAQISGNHHQRAGIGFEVWGDNIKLAANGYYRLSDWKTSSLLTGTKERAANGFDLVAETFLPAYPQVGAKVKYERYFGAEVVTLSRNERYRNPSALTAGLTYSPVPLITFGADHARWNNGKTEGKANLSLNYHFNVPLAKQLDPHYTPLRRSLAGSRLDVVARNNNIVLEYQRREQIHFQLPTELSGVEGERKHINFRVSAKHDISRIEWDDSALKPAGGQVVTLNNNAYQVQFPDFSSHGTNQYVVSAVAYDKRGNASNRSEMTINTEPYPWRQLNEQNTADESKMVISTQDNINQPEIIQPIVNPGGNEKKDVKSVSSQTDDDGIPDDTSDINSDMSDRGKKNSKSVSSQTDDDGIPTDTSDINSDMSDRGKNNSKSVSSQTDDDGIPTDASDINSDMSDRGKNNSKSVSSQTEDNGIATDTSGTNGSPPPPPPPPPPPFNSESKERRILKKSSGQQPPHRPEITLDVIQKAREGLRKVSGQPSNFSNEHHDQLGRQPSEHDLLSKIKASVPQVLKKDIPSNESKDPSHSAKKLDESLIETLARRRGHVIGDKNEDIDDKHNGDEVSTEVISATQVDANKPIFVQPIIV